MEIKSMRFKANASGALVNTVLQGNLKTSKGKFVTRRAETIKELDDFEGTRDAATAIRNRVIDNLDLWLERFEQKAQDTGAQVLWARDGAEVCRLVTEIAKSHGVKKVTKSKSMVSEEMALNRAFEAAGIQDGEQRAGMDVGLEVDGAILGLQAARAEPLACRPVQPAGRGVTQRTGEGVVKTVGPHAELGLADGHEVEAHAGVKLEGPIVVRHAGEHMPGTELPPGRHHAVLDPEGVVAFPAQGDIEA